MIGRISVLYDADCGFCRWSLAQVLALDRDHQLRPVALGTQEADRLLSDLSEAQRNASWHLISPGGQRASAGAAAAPWRSPSSARRTASASSGESSSSPRPSRTCFAYRRACSR